MINVGLGLTEIVAQRPHIRRVVRKVDTMPRISSRQYYMVSMSLSPNMQLMLAAITNSGFSRCSGVDYSLVVSYVI